MKDFISEELEAIRRQSLWRELQILEGSSPAELVIDGKPYLNFSSNDYLGTSHHPAVVQAAIDALNRYGSGGRSSRLISGTLDLHRALEVDLARMKGTESCLLFPTGFMANLGVISALIGEGDAVLMDRLNHASLIDAARLAHGRIFVYRHASPESLEKVLTRTRSYRKRLVVTDGLFSMDGDLAPLKEIVALCKKSGVWLMVDDAHATGVLGRNGSGVAEHFGLFGQIEIVMGTLSKALGSQGGFVCGSRDLVEFLINRARPFIFTTALSPAACAAARKALELIAQEPEKRERLRKLSSDFRKRLAEDFPQAVKPVSATPTPILPFLTRVPAKTLHLARALKDRGIFVPAIRPPTVPKGECRLRFSLTSAHKEEDLERLFCALFELAAEDRH